MAGKAKSKDTTWELLSERARKVHHRNAVAHQLRSSMAYEFRVEISAGSYSCIGRVRQLINDTSRLSRIADDKSTLTAHVDTGSQVIEVPVSAIVDVKRAS